MKLLFINGANLNMTGKREQEIYGVQSIDEINCEIAEYFKEDECEFFQTNSEGGICDKLHSAECDGIILNAGAYSHYSYAIRDAISSIKIPVVEVHISNIFAREEFRRKSILSEVCKGVIVGFGKKSYILAGESFKI